MPEERVALIAGASGEIGAAVSRRLARDGASVYIGYNSSAKAASVVAEDILKKGGRAEYLHLDITDPEEVESVCEKIYKTDNRLDILVNCVAANMEAPALGMEDDLWEEVLQINLSGAFRLCRTAARYMLLGRWGRLVNLSSVAASFGGRGQINYASGKAGLESMTRVFALELGRKGVTANCVAPGVIETTMSERVRQEHGEELLRAIALRRFGCTEEVADTVAFLTSEMAAYITGEVIHVDGGMGLG